MSRYCRVELCIIDHSNRPLLHVPPFLPLMSTLLKDQFNHLCKHSVHLFGLYLPRYQTEVNDSWAIDMIVSFDVKIEIDTILYFGNPWNWMQPCALCQVPSSFSLKLISAAASVMPFFSPWLHWCIISAATPAAEIVQNYL